MKFQVETHYYNEEQLRQLITAQGRFGRRTIYYVLGVLLLAACLVALWPSVQAGDWHSALLTLLGLAAVYGYYLFHLRRCKPTDRSTRRTAKKAAAKMGDKTDAVTFTFRDESFVVMGSRAAEEVRYGELLRAAESDYCFILQIQRGFFIVPKEDFTTGTPEEFAAFLEGKTGRAVKRLDY